MIDYLVLVAPTFSTQCFIGHRHHGTPLTSGSFLSQCDGNFFTKTKGNRCYLEKMHCCRIGTQSIENNYSSDVNKAHYSRQRS